METGPHKSLTNFGSFAGRTSPDDNCKTSLSPYLSPNHQGHATLVSYIKTSPDDNCNTSSSPYLSPNRQGHATLVSYKKTSPDDNCKTSPSPYVSPNRQGPWGTPDDFTNSFYIFSVLHCSLGLGELQAWPLPDVLFPPLFFCLPCLLPPFTMHAGWFWPELMNGRLVHTTLVYISLRWPGGLRMVRLPARSWLRLPHW